MYRLRLLTSVALIGNVVFKAPTTTDIYTLSLHDALPISGAVGAARIAALAGVENAISFDMGGTSTDVCLIAGGRRSEEHTSELQSHSDLVCRLLLEKKN